MNADAFRVLRWLNVQATVWCVLLIGPPWLAVAAVTEAWVQRYSGGASNAQDRAYAVVRDLDENIIVAGTSDNNATGSDVIIFKYSGEDGALLWRQRYDSLNNSDDAVQALAVDRQGNVLVTGFSTRGGDFETADYFTLKYAGRSGELLWEKRYAGPGNKDDIPQALVVDGNGNVVVTGYSVGAANNYDIYTVKYAAADGALLWEKRYNGGASDYGKALALDSRDTSWSPVIPKTKATSASTRQSMLPWTGLSSGSGATTMARRTSLITPRLWQWTATGMYS